MQVSNQLVKTVRTRGPRLKLEKQWLERQERVQQFTRRIVGPWWELIRRHQDDDDCLSFCHVAEDRFHNSISISDGQGYTPKGFPGSRWTCQKLIPRILEEDHKVNYHWEGYLEEESEIPYHGWGEIMYIGPADSDKPFEIAHEKFWDVSEIFPDTTRSKMGELRRMTSQEYETMLNGGDQQKQKLVLKTFRNWNRVHQGVPRG